MFPSTAQFERKKQARCLDP